MTLEAATDPMTEYAVARLRYDAAAESELRRALWQLQQGRGFVVRAADLLGGFVGSASRFGLRQLGMNPAIQGKFQGLAEAALSRAYDAAILGLNGPASGSARLSRSAVLLSGAAGGFAGLAGFVPDATLTTLAIMREIARIAREEGEDLNADPARRACLEVFAFRTQGGPSESELGYYSARFLLGGRTLTALIGEVAGRYGLVLGEKFAAQAVPVLGALAGATLNAAFLAHYRDLARAHFTIRRLERNFGAAVIQAAAEAMQDAKFNG